ncbi:MAG TPA: choice-of-anchor D domain-containing protein [Solirubrobacterales bacterium]|jgi:hypothetical protein|nr:choice-of-anchor D domain-containing protein [Solirubrobacterales bacterium]
MSPSGSSPARNSRVLTGLLAATALVLLALPASGRAAEATAVLTPASQSFTATIVGQHSTQQYFELRDEGPEPIQVSTVAIGGPDSADFSLESSSCFGTTLSPGSSCGVYVAFTPTQGGGREATLEAVHDGEGSPTTAALEGTGLRQEVTLSPSPLVFPTTTRNMSSEKQLTIANQSDVAVTIFGTNFEGPGAGAFGTNGSDCAGTLGVGSTCKIDVRFSPQSEGEQRAFLHINAEGPGGGPIVELQGLGAAPELSFEPGSFDFGLAPTNEGGERTRLVLRNVGPAPTQVGIETSGGSGAFSIGESDCWGATLAVGGTCSVQVYFRPNETGPYAGVVRATSAGISFDAELTGRGGQAVLSSSPNPLDFGSAVVGSRSGPRTVTIENSGDLAGGFFIAVISGGDSASFQLIEENCTGTPIAPGGKCQAVVRFQPTGAGLRRATLGMFGDSEGGQQIALSGAGVDPGLPTPLPSAHSFGAQAVGTSGGVQLFTFTNQSAVATELAGTTLGGEDPDQFRIARDGCSETSLAPGASCQVGVRFAPGEAGAKSATLRLGSTGGVVTAALSGFAEAAVGTAAISATSLRVPLRLAGRPLHLGGQMLRVGTFSCPSEQDCQVVARATIVKSPASIKTTGARPIGPWRTKLAIPAGAKRELVLRLGAADRAAARDGRLRLRWEARSGSRRSTGSAEVSLR